MHTGCPLPPLPVLSRRSCDEESYRPGTFSVPNFAPGALDYLFRVA